MLNQEFDLNKLDNRSRYQNFIIFDPASIRVHDADIFLIGKDVKNLFDSMMSKLVSKEQSIKERILHNRLSKIGQMLELLNTYDQVIICRFFDRIWRRYSYISHLGESFLDLETFLAYFPDYEEKGEDVLALRFDEKDTFDEESSDDDDDDSEDDESSEEEQAES